MIYLFIYLQGCPDARRENVDYRASLKSTGSFQFLTFTCDSSQHPHIDVDYQPRW